jgi:hypothetical protein
MKRDLIQELLKDIEQIEDNAKLYLQGRSSAYQAVAIQLRNVMLDGRRGLLGRVAPDLLLQPFRPSNAPKEVLDAFHTPSDTRVHALMDVRGFLRLSTGDGPSVSVHIEFLEPPSLTIGEWLNQWIIRPDLTVHDLILAVADEEVAHTQDTLGKAASKATQWRFGGRAEGQELRHAVIVALGQYIAKRVREVALTQEVQR